MPSISNGSPIPPDLLQDLLPPPGLDVAQAEAWASGVIAEFDELDAVLSAIERDRPPTATVLLSGLAAVADERDATRAADRLAELVAGGAEVPPWLTAGGTAAPVDARQAVTGRATVVAIRYAHDEGTTHTMLIEIASARVVGVRFGSGDLFELLEDDTTSDEVSLTDMDLASARTIISAALAEPITGDGETWVNAALASRRLETLGVTVTADFRPPPGEYPGVEADPAAARFSVDVMRSALRGAWSDDDAWESDEAIVAALAERVRPSVVIGADEDEARALCHLEWADWIGAVIGLVRAGAGASCAPADLVGYINRCPEVTTSIPRREAEQVGACFAAAMTGWAERGLTDGERLTELGQRVLPQVLLAVAAREGADSVAGD